MNQMQLEKVMQQNPDRTWGECSEDTPSRFLSPYGKTFRPLPVRDLAKEQEVASRESRRRSPSKITRKEWDGK